MRISDLSAFIFDLDGVVWRGATPIEGAAQSIASLQAAGKRCFYCTNNASSPPSAFGERLRAMGIEAQDEDVMTSSTATALYLQSQFTGQFSAFVVGENGLIDALRKVGARVVTMQESGAVDENDFPVDCVVAGIDRNFNYKKLTVAQRCIGQGARFVATNRDATFPVEGGVAPGAGSIVVAIETASGTTPLTIGKPQPLMANLLIHKFGLDPNTTAMIGDRLDTDIVFARRARIAALFVATGVSTRQEATDARRDFKPDAMFDDLLALCQAVLNNSASAPAGETPTPAALDAVTQSSATQGAPMETTANVSSSASDFVLPPSTESASETASDESSATTQVAAEAPSDESGKSAFDSDFGFASPQTNPVTTTDAAVATSEAVTTSEAVAASENATAVDVFSLDAPVPQQPQAPQTIEVPTPQTATSSAASDAAMFSLDDQSDGASAIPIATVDAANNVAQSAVPQPAIIESAPIAGVPQAAPQSEATTENWWESMDDIFNDQTTPKKKTPGA